MAHKGIGTIRIGSIEDALCEVDVVCIEEIADGLLLLDRSLRELPALAPVLGMASGVRRCQSAVPPPITSANMQSTMMTMRAQAPLALSARPARSTQRVARPMSVSTQLGQMARVSGTPLQSITATRMPAGIRRRHRMLIEATKKSVGDLQKSDLEGKRVLVRLYVPLKCCQYPQKAIGLLSLRLHDCVVPYMHSHLHLIMRLIYYTVSTQAPF